MIDDQAAYRAAADRERCGAPQPLRLTAAFGISVSAVLVLAVLLLVAASR
ncbi:hypothetical protein [Kitasatospora sp. A2-31]|nr:hypothetical protein [Kitasatospora sp. A2-31]MCG6493460.1 hypothetical protein [Kitasatospora sp. A2-31]